MVTGKAEYTKIKMEHEQMVQPAEVNIEVSPVICRTKRKQ